MGVLRTSSPHLRHAASSPGHNAVCCLCSSTGRAMLRQESSQLVPGTTLSGKNPTIHPRTKRRVVTKVETHRMNRNIALQQKNISNRQQRARTVLILTQDGHLSVVHRRAFIRKSAKCHHTEETLTLDFTRQNVPFW